MNKIGEYILTPFVILADYVIRLIIYLIFIQSRIIKLPFTNVTLYDFYTWNNSDEYQVKQRQKDILILSVLWSFILVGIFLPWYWIFLLLLAYIVAFLTITIIGIQKAHKE